MKSLIIFDLDGTLVDTINDLAAACNHALSCEGFPTHHVSTYQYYVGNGVTKLIERALPADSVNPETISRVRNRFIEYYDLHDTDASRPYYGIEPVLKHFNNAGIRMAVASNKYQTAAERVIRTLFPDIPWVAIEGQKANINVKPDPSVIFEILSKCPTPKSEVLLVGDSAVDMETARRACVESVGVTWGFRPESELVAAGADRIIHAPSELIDVVASMNS